MNQEFAQRALYVVMAGGRGERLRPLTDTHPKPLVRFGPSGRIIDFTLFNCLVSGHGDVLVLTQYRSEMLESYLDEYWRPAFEARWRSIEVAPSGLSTKRSYMGTADAVYQALSSRRDVPGLAVVLAGDHVYRMNYRAMIDYHQSHPAVATVGAVASERDQAHRFGIIQAGESGRVKQFHEKPRSLEGIVPRGRKPLASMGIYVFNTPGLMDFLEKAQGEGGHDFGHDVLPAMSEEEEVFAYPFQTNDGHSGYWRDVGDLNSFWQSQMEMIDGRCRELFFDVVPGLKNSPFSMSSFIRRSTDGRRVFRSLVSESASIGAATVTGSVVCPGVRIEDGAEVERSVVMDGAVVRRGARLHSVVVEPGAEVRGGLDCWAQPIDAMASFAPGIHVMASVPILTQIGGISGPGKRLQPA